MARCRCSADVPMYAVKHPGSTPALDVIEACTELTNEQLDAKPLSLSEWSIRQALTHLVECQQR